MRGQSIPANGGVIQGQWFVFDPDVLADLRRRHGPGVPARVSGRPRRCGPTPFAPTLGGHYAAGGYCEPEGVEDAWDATWRGEDRRHAPPPGAWRAPPRPGFGEVSDYPGKIDLVMIALLAGTLGAVLWVYKKPEDRRVAR